ncbi:MAG: ATP-dependent 6-phosphofructokinase [Chitinispirillales bacterium]|jgi:6-phosphofructokinase 1|nr:ATP-dependent 6-phosphofructokinase [Chitinispirillales bacterium]
MNIGLLTSGGDCAGLNAVMYGFVKAITAFDPKVEIYGIIGGYSGLINRSFRKMKHEEFANILNVGGTILGTSRLSYKELVKSEDNETITAIKENYHKMGLDILIVLGGQGTYKKAKLLADEGIKLICLPKTIDNDIFGTDITFGFHSAVDVATECIDRIRTTAASHGRTMLVEIMGNKVGWLTLYAGIGGGADIILIPEIPYDIDKVVKAAQKANDRNGYCVMAVAEGAMDKDEAALSKKERCQKREERGEITDSNRIAKVIASALNTETRVMVTGHIVRGGNPTPYDRIICTQMGAYAAKLVNEKQFGATVAISNGKITHNNLVDIAGETKFVSKDHELVQASRDVGITFGD